MALSCTINIIMLLSVSEKSPLSYEEEGIGKVWRRGAMLWSSTFLCFSVLKDKGVKEHQPTDWRSVEEEREQTR